MKKYKSNWNTLRKTITVINEDNSIYAEFDYIDWLQFRVEYLQSERLHKMKFYIRNEHGGMNAIDELGNTYNDGFGIISKLLRLIVESQINLRK